MYVARFSYDLLPINRQRGVDFVRKEVETAIRNGLNARLLVPLTRGQSGSPALQFEVELTNLDQLDQFRSRGPGSAEDIKSWMHAFSKILTAPPPSGAARANRRGPPALPTARPTPGSETETTLARNRAALDAWGFRPRVLRDVSNVDCSRAFFGKKLRIPVLCSAVGGLEVFEPGGGATVAAATREFGNGMILSSRAHPGLEKTAEASAGAFKIFQLYVRGDAAWVDDHVRRAIDNGYDAFCFTIDTDSHSRRERDIAKRHQRRRARLNATDEEARIHQARFNWRDIERVKKNFDIPIVLKGIGTAEDAKLALECGADCVYVSNHGGRQLDQGVGSIDVLPEVVEAVGGRARIMVDGGIYRGTDVVKALILGADVVSVGRLYIYGLAAAGRPGVVRLFEILEDEIRICLSLLGVTGYHELDKSYIRPARQVVTPHVHSVFPHLNLPRETY